MNKKIKLPSTYLNNAFSNPTKASFGKLRSHEIMYQFSKDVRRKRYCYKYLLHYFSTLREKSITDFSLFFLLLNRSGLEMKLANQSHGESVSLSPDKLISKSQRSLVKMAKTFLTKTCKMPRRLKWPPKWLVRSNTLQIANLWLQPNANPSLTQNALKFLKKLVKQCKCKSQNK